MSNAQNGKVSHGHEVDSGFDVEIRRWSNQIALLYVEEVATLDRWLEVLTVEPDEDLQALAQCIGNGPVDTHLMVRPGDPEWPGLAQRWETLEGGGRTAMTETMITVGQTRLSVAALLALPQDEAGWRTVACGARVWIGPGVRIGPGCVIGPHVVIGSGCRIHHRVVLSAECRLYPRVVIDDDSGIGERVVIHADSWIGAHVVIGADSRIGERVVIGADTRLGSRVELGNGCRTYHRVVLSDDSRIGARVVLGAECRIGPGVALSDNSRLVARVVLRAGLFTEHPRERGYAPVTYRSPSGERRIASGCRDLSFAEARAHWGAADYPDRARGDAYLAILDADESRP